jgi:hypothetical protein
VKKSAWILLGIVLLILYAAPSPAQVITTEEVEAVMEDPYVQSAFKTCAVGNRVPAELDIVLIINEKGKAVLAFSNPEVTVDVFGCFQKVVQTLSFKATGQKFEITYPLEFPESGAVAAPPPGGETPPPGGTAPPPGTTGATVGSVGSYKPPPAAAGSMQPPVAYEFWTREVKKGRTLMGVGGLLIGLGIGGMVAGVIVYKLYEDTDSKTTGTIVLIVGIAGGIALTYGGLHLFITGQKRAKKAQAVLESQYAFLIPRLSVVPILSKQGGGMASALTWTF